jgi:hypothetical protein
MQTSGHTVALSVYLYANVRAHDTTKGTLGAMLFVSIYTVMISRSVEVTRHFEHPMRTSLDAELTSLAALFVNHHIIHGATPFFI